MYQERRMERSVGMILIIPFGICFILLFLVCCFADEMKKMCILPSQIPLSYRNTSPTFNTTRRQEAAAAHQNRIDPEDVEEQGFVVEQNETEQLISEELPIDLVVHGNYNNGSNRTDNNSNSINSSCHQQPTDFCCSNNSSEQYISYNNTGLRFGDGGEEAETSLIPAVIRQSSLQRNQVHTSFSDICNQDMITSDLISSRSVAAVNASSTSSISTITNEATASAAAAPPPPKPQPNSHQVEVTVCVNNHFQPTDS
ncbi:uncharacterized protein LOC128249386 [Octopus bimaculoides]|uniref:Uncharacterized protein n=1 Tax=Octopus bimaculoides TaxID=37653 RepID=A0A0L8FKA8_OCTBM|nr:uncharacterized protein LOC128249386 [Octopus bimaculoides]XP_052828795.1 uncharacterized protein LOC128249386 [Octopus bimaculoides]XP_052828799.1 uncharacterized protein LOC128249386 [Octopus bimaculoides]